MAQVVNTGQTCVSQWTDNVNGKRATSSCTLEVVQRRPDQSRLNNTTRWQPWNSAQGCSRRLGSAGRSSSDRSLRSSPLSRAAIGGGLLELVHCWKRASKRLGTKRLGPDKGWVRPTLGTRCSLFIKRAYRHTLFSASRPTVSALPYGDFPSTAPTPSPTAGPQGTLPHRVLKYG